MLAYVAGLGGIAGGTFLLRDGEIAMAIVLWLVTFAVGATLMGIALLIRALSGVSLQLTRLEADVRTLTEDHAPRPGGPGTPERDPWLRH